jgi:hypothetical protein
MAGRKKRVLTPVLQTASPALSRQKRIPLWRAALIIHFVFLSFPFFLNALNLILPALMSGGKKNPHRAVDCCDERRHFAGINVRRLSAGLELLRLI